MVRSSVSDSVGYGAWDSPISSQLVAKGSVSVLDMHVDGEYTYWSEMRPSNAGRYTLVRVDASGCCKDLTPPDFNVRTFVHEYGGGAFTVAQGVVYASNGVDGAIYKIEPDCSPTRLTDGKIRFADMHITPYGLVAVGESHEPDKTVLNFLALIDLSTGSHKKLASGYDFYSSPAISSDGKKIAWISWNHPHMPWTETELWSAEFTLEGDLIHQTQICGSIPESIFQPEWSPDQVLYFVTDRERGWWNLHRFVNGRIENVCSMQAEMGRPLWVFGLSTYAFLGDKIVFTYNCEGIWRLALLDPKTQQWVAIKQEGTFFHHLRSTGHQVRFLERYPTRNEALFQIEEHNPLQATCLYTTPSIIEEGYLSTPEPITFPSAGRQSHAFFYPPKNRDYQGKKGEKPPLIVMVHGGPTSQAMDSLQMKLQFWTSRGFAVLDVNYGGSTGYGRAYRQLLDRNWGVVDVEDCVNGSVYLVEKGLVDGNKLAIRGGSAGGYTTLAALAFSQTFKAGASHYGVADITVLACDTHKFESHYMYQLIGKYPEEKALWQSRSPIHSVDKITAPLILFQGEEDLIVPKNQAIMIYEALKNRGMVVELYLFPGEKHGFVQAKNIIESLDREVAFYLKVFK